MSPTRLSRNPHADESFSPSMRRLLTGVTTVVGRANGWTPRSAVHDAAVADGGSVAWVDDSGFWIRDAAGTRKVAEAQAGSGPLLRDGSTVTWSGGGPTVTLDP